MNRSLKGEGFYEPAPANDSNSGVVAWTKTEHEYKILPKSLLNIETEPGIAWLVIYSDETKMMVLVAYAKATGQVERAGKIEVLKCLNQICERLANITLKIPKHKANC